MTQNEALLILKTGANVFLTGEPGSGKTHTINHYVAYLRSCGIEPAITASTGIAATHIGGLTIHSWSGIGIRRDLTAPDLDRIRMNRNIVRRVGSTHILIIDEVSMLSARTLAMVDMVCREIKKSQRPFGGLQVILVGDFFQLPPINKREESGGQESLEAAEEQFAFASPVWDALDPTVCYLSEQHRQEDPIFLELLGAIRKNSITESHRALLRSRYASKSDAGVTRLYSHNANVDQINTVELAKLTGETKRFEMAGRGSEKVLASLKRGCLSPEVLLLKTGARVMFTKNDVTTHRYVNGTLGTVTGFSKESGYPVVKTNRGRTIYTEPDEWHIEEGGRILARIIQIPLRLAWAMTIHKSQGLSLDAANIDLSDAFEYGQGYVALSRVRTLAGLSLNGLNARALEVHPEIFLKDAEFRAQSQRVREKFNEVNPKEIALTHINFITACGGQLAKTVAQTDSVAAISTYDATRKFVLQKRSLKDIARARNITLGTIIGHLEKLAAEKKIDPGRDLAHIERDPARFEEIKRALINVYRREGKMLLSPARALLGEAYSYDEIRFARLFIEA